MVAYDDTIALDFGDDDPRFDALEVTVREVDVPTYRRAVVLTDGDLDPGGDDKQQARVDEFVALVGATLVSWNLTNPDGGPVPADAQHLAAQPHKRVRRLLNAWIVGQVSMAAPLALPSQRGETPVAIPVEPLAS
jgi:hypothetical protein